jgi:hypothetical protein
VDEQLLRALENNARWCDLVCRSAGVPTEVRRGLWLALRRSPPLYPDAVTLSPIATAGDVAEAVVRGPGCSVKDSFADIDLGAHGFEVLFEARWICRRSSPPPRPAATAAWSVITERSELTEWALAAGDRVAVPRDALHHPTVRVLGARGPSGISAGAIAHRTGPVVGVSNVFGDAAADPATWTAIADALAVTFPSLPLVGYEHGDSLRAAVSSGFEEIGALRVWIEPSRSPT